MATIMSEKPGYNGGCGVEESGDAALKILPDSRLSKRIFHF
jgi:hypothetical protein